mgnify:CR=1 FL=1
MIKFLKQNLHYIIFAIFLLIHSLICIFTTYFGDDYYYAAFIKKGADYFVSENIFHYQYTNGRALVHLLDELLLGVSFWFWRIFNIVSVGLLIIGIAKIASRCYRADIASRRYEYSRAVIAASAIFGIIDLAILRATGALNYLFPTTALVWFYYFYRRDFERFSGSWLLVIPAFFVAATTEQVSAAAVLVSLCFIVSSVVVKRLAPKPAYIASFVSSAAGFCTLYLSPGNSARTEYYPDFYALSLFERVRYNFRELMTVVLGRGGIGMIVCLAFILVIYVCVSKYILPNRDGKSARNISTGGAVSLSGKAIHDSKINSAILTTAKLTAIVTSLALGLYVYGLAVNPQLLQLLPVGFIIALPILAVMVWTAVRYFRHGKIDDLFFVWCAVAMQCAMAFSPEYGPRTLLISVVSLMIPVVRVFASRPNPMVFMSAALVVFALMPSYMSTPLLFIALTVILLAGAFILYSDNIRALAASLAVAVCLGQFATVAAGYYENVETLKLNERQVESYDSTSNEPLVLYYLPNAQYKYTMPYDDPYHQRVYLILYGLSPDTPVEYREPTVAAEN